MPTSALVTRPTSANLPSGEPPGKLRRRKSLGEVPRKAEGEQNNSRLEEAKRRSQEEQQRIDFYKANNLDDEDEARAVEMDPMYYEAPPYPKELLKDEIEEEERRRKAIDDQRRKRNRKLSITDTNKKMVSQILANGLVEGRKIWTEEEIVERDLDETIDAFRKKRDTENWSKKKGARGGVKGTGDTLDARIGRGQEGAKEKIIVVHDEDFDPRRNIEEDDVGEEVGDGNGRQSEGGGMGKERVYREYRHSWSKTSLIEMARDAEKEKQEAEKKKKKGYEGLKMILNKEDPMKPILMDEEGAKEEGGLKKRRARCVRVLEKL